MSQSSTAPSQLIPRCARTSAASFLATILTSLLSLTPLAAPSQAHAQCQEGWQPFDPSTAAFPGVRGYYYDPVYATTMWDPDGPGPLAPRLVIAGSFAMAGNTFAKNIATYDFSTGQWASLGTGIDGASARVYALTTMANGDLIAAGSFSSAGGVPVNNIARWNGSQWSALGRGIDSFYAVAYAVTTLANGDLIAGGSFTSAGGVPANGIARWDGTSWSPLGTGMASVAPLDYYFAVYALTSLPNGDVIAGGLFNIAGGLPASSIARWNGSTWNALGAGITGGLHEDDPFVSALTAMPNGDLIAGGYFTSAGGATASNIARWDGATWSPLGSGVAPDFFGFGKPIVSVLKPLPGGDLIAGGSFATAGGSPANCIARWNGATWSPLGAGMEGNAQYNPSVTTLQTLPGGDLIAGGYFYKAGGKPAFKIARWNQSASGGGGGEPQGWSPLGSCINGQVKVLALLPSGDLIAGGNFTSVGSVTANQFARWHESSYGPGTWSPLGTGPGGDYSFIGALAMLPNGDLIAGGFFSTADQLGFDRMARWDGTTWSVFGAGTDGDVYALLPLANGDLIAAGYFTSAGGVAANYIARWDGSTWSPLGTGVDGDYPYVSALATLPNGDLIVAGSFDTAGGVTVNNVACWSSAGGGSWSALGGGIAGRVTALTILPSGDLIAAGDFRSAGGISANRIARWNGSTWSALGAGIGIETANSYQPIFTLTVLPNGDLIAGGYFSVAGGVAVSNIARWDGSTWSAVGAGTDFFVYSLTTLPNGDLVAGGDFSIAGGTIAPFLARYTFASSCQGCSLADIAGGFTGAANTRRPDGVVDGTDFVAFINSFAIADVSIDPLADIAGGSGTGTGNAPNPDGIIDGADFVAFINAFAVGC